MEFEEQALRRILREHFGKGTKLVHGLANEVRRVRRMLRAKMTPTVQRPTHVLVTVEPDGHIEVRCEQHVRVRIAHLPGAHSAAAANVVEELMLRWLPRPYQQLLATTPAHYQGDVRMCPTGASLLEALHTQEAMHRAANFKKTITANTRSSGGAA